MLSVVIPTLNEERALGPTLAALVQGTLTGMVKEVIIVDGGSTDDTSVVADAAGCVFVAGDSDRGARLAAGAREAWRGHWLLFLPAGTVPGEGWHTEIAQFIERVELSGDIDQAACFKFALAGLDAKARRAERSAAFRWRFFAHVRPEQGLLISRHFYDSLGGHRAGKHVPEADIAHRIGRRRLHRLETVARVGKLRA